MSVIPPKNYLDKKFQTMLRPLNFLLWPHFQCKFCIRDDFIMPLKVFNRVLNVICLVVTVALLIGRFAYYFQHQLDLLRISMLHDCLIFSLATLLNVFKNIYDSDNFTSLILKIHNVYKMRYDFNSDFKWFSVFNWAWFVTIFFLYIIYFNVVYAARPFEIVFQYIIFSFDMNLLYAIRIIILIKNEFKVCVAELESCSGTYLKDLEDFAEQRNRNSRIYWKRIQEVYTQLTEAFVIFKNHFQLAILFYVVATFLKSLFYVQLTIKSWKLNLPTAKWLTQLFPMWMFKNLLVISMLCVSCEMYYLTLGNVEILVAKIINLEGISVEGRRTLKNVIRVKRTSFSKVNAGGVFDVDKHLMTQLLRVLTTYTIVLLQFAFQSRQQILDVYYNINQHYFNITTEG